ncbi:MAG TPA: hypothetical protein VEO56_16590 [Bacteroidota bacterium]|nr:hypothetical protein [Bacteroidota bacterium]
MPRPGIILILPFIAASFLPVPIASTSPGKDEHAALWQVVQSAEDILGGKNIGQARNTITKGASLIYGTRFENLRRVVGGEVAGCSLADTSYHGVMIQAETNPSEEMGFIILKTVTADSGKVRYHTLVVEKDSTGQYRIHHWHTDN